MKTFKSVESKWQQMKINSSMRGSSGALAIRCWWKALIEEIHAVEAFIRRLYQTAGDVGFD